MSTTYAFTETVKWEANC